MDYSEIFMLRLLGVKWCLFCLELSRRFQRFLGARCHLPLVFSAFCEELCEPRRCFYSSWPVSADGLHAASERTRTKHKQLSLVTCAFCGEMMRR